MPWLSLFKKLMWSWGRLCTQLWPIKTFPALVMHFLFTRKPICPKPKSIHMPSLNEHWHSLKWQSPWCLLNNAATSFIVDKQLKGFETSKTIVKNGTYIQHRYFEPALGYRSALEISNPLERKERGLPEREEESPWCSRAC